MHVRTLVVLATALVTVPGAVHRGDGDDWRGRMQAAELALASRELRGLEEELVRLTREAECPDERVKAFVTLGRYYELAPEDAKTEQSFLRARYWLAQSEGRGDAEAQAELAIHLLVLYVEGGQIGKAERESETLLLLLESKAAVSAGKRAYALAAMGTLHFAAGRHGEAQVLLERSLVAMEDAGLRKSHVAMRALSYLGSVYLVQRRLPEAERVLLECTAELKKAGMGESEEMVAPLTNLATVYSYAGRPAEAEAAYDRAYLLAEASLGSGHPLLADVLRAHAEYAARQGQKAEARKLNARARAIQQTLPGRRPATTVDMTELLRQRQR